MIAEEVKIRLKPEMDLRPCYILGHDKSKIKALFHCWTAIDYGYGTHNIKTAAIVELEDGSVTLIHPQSIKFVSGIFNEYSWVEEEDLE